MLAFENMADQISKSALALARARAFNMADQIGESAPALARELGKLNGPNSWAGGGTEGSALALENMPDRISKSALALARAGAFNMADQISKSAPTLARARAWEAEWARLVRGLRHRLIGACAGKHGRLD